MQAGGLPVSVANVARLEQLLRGSTSELMLPQLRIRERIKNPPPFLMLLREVMEEESRQSAKQSQVTPSRPQRVRTIQVGVEKEPDLAMWNDLQTQIQELRAQLDERNKIRHQSPPEEPVKSHKENRKKKIESQSELQLLRKQVKALEDKVSVMTVKYTSESPREPSLQSRRYKADPGHKLVYNSFFPKDEEYFCYRCGDIGHIATRCSGPENPQKVISKLIRLERRLPEPTKESPKSTAEEQCVAKVNKVEVPEMDANLPEGLVGPSFIHTIKVNDVVCDALIDSGSNVTIIFEDWYKQNLAGVPIKPLSGLGLWGLAVTEYPYRGYVIVEMEFTEEITGVLGCVEVLALICPNTRNQQQIPVLVGTNTSLFRRLWDLVKRGDKNVVHSMRIQSVYALEMP